MLTLDRIQCVTVGGSFNIRVCFANTGSSSCCTWEYEHTIPLGISVKELVTQLSKFVYFMMQAYQEFQNGTE